MSPSTFFAFERMFDRYATFILLALGGMVAGATTLVGG